jgi:hypothetical protein
MKSFALVAIMFATATLAAPVEDDDYGYSAYGAYGAYSPSGVVAYHRPTIPNFHQVTRRGETCSSVAKENGVSLAAIKKQNYGINCNNLKVDTHVRLKPCYDWKKYDPNQPLRELSRAWGVDYDLILEWNPDAFEARSTTYLCAKM